jgi:hypothetical protein
LKAIEARPGVPPQPKTKAMVCTDCIQVCKNAGSDTVACDKKCGSCLDKILTRDKKDDARWEAEMEVWRPIAHAGLDEAVKKASRGLPDVAVMTDLQGVAQVELEEGDWYVSGMATVGSLVMWDDVKVEVKPGLEKFELSNDNTSYPPRN